MAVEKLPVPTTQLETSDYGTVFQQKMNEAMDNLRNAIIAYNNQVDAYQTAADFTEIASTEEMQAGANNTKRVTPLGTNAAITHRIGTAGQLGNAALRTVGQANGVVPLDNNNKIPLEYLSDSVLGQVEYKGTWNAATNIPALPTTPAKKGDYYVVSVGGTRFGNTFGVGDWIISNGTSWDKVANTDAVTSVQGRTGNVTVTKADVGLGSVDNFSAAALRSRSSHTGTQPLSTISDAGEAAYRGVAGGAGDLIPHGYMGLGANGPRNSDLTVSPVSQFVTTSAAGSGAPAQYTMGFSCSYDSSRSVAILFDVLSGNAWVRKWNGGSYTDYRLMYAGNTIDFGNSVSSARAALELGDFATRSITFSTSAPSTAQINAMAAGDMWGVYS